MRDEHASDTSETHEEQLDKGDYGVIPCDINSDGQSAPGSFWWQGHRSHYGGRTTRSIPNL